MKEAPTARVSAMMMILFIPLFLDAQKLDGENQSGVRLDDKGSQVNLTQRRLYKDGTRKTIHNNSKICIYDMISIFLRARSFDPTDWKKGHALKIPIADGNGIEYSAQLRYRGKSVVKADNNKKYRCLELSYMEPDDGKYKEIRHRLLPAGGPSLTSSRRYSACKQHRRRHP